MVIIAVIVMLHALVTNDFSIRHVASYTSTTLPLLFTRCPPCGAAWKARCCSGLHSDDHDIAARIWQNRRANRELMPYVTATCMVTERSSGLLVFITPPFARLPFGDRPRAPI
jgi:cytochrome c biogenesis factor